MSNGWMGLGWVGWMDIIGRLLPTGSLRAPSVLINKHSWYECHLFPLKTHIWRIKTLHPYTSVEHVSFCPSLIPVALHPPWFGLSVFYLRNFIDLFFYCPPIKVVELLKVIKESSSRPALISGCKKGFIEEKTDSETLNATRKNTGKHLSLDP